MTNRVHSDSIAIGSALIARLTFTPACTAAVGAEVAALAAAALGSLSAYYFFSFLAPASHSTRRTITK